MRRRHSSHNSALLGADASVRAARFLRAAQRAKRLDGRWSGGYPLQTPACSNRRPGGFVSELIALFSWEIGIVSPYCRIRAAKMATMTFNSKYNFKAVVSHVQVENDSEEPTHLVWHLRFKSPLPPYNAISTCFPICCSSDDSSHSITMQESVW